MRSERFKNLLIYGAGLAGQHVHAYLAACGKIVDGFLDRDPALCKVNSLPVASAEQWAKTHEASGTCVVIGVFNPYADMREIFDHLERLGYGKIVSLVEFVRHNPDGQPFRYWLVDPRFYEHHANRIAEFRAELADEISRELLDRIVEFRTHGDPRCLPLPSECQYFPADLPKWPETLRFIDCGSYTGDTVQALQNAGYRFEALATFEPNLINYQTLVDNLKHIVGAAHFPCGVSDENRLAGFDPSLGQGGHLLKEGGEPVVCVRLDDALPGFAPNLIKMDIEGEEPAALCGAKKILSLHRPHLAISTYHRAEHLWEIGEQIRSLDLGYSFYIRTHAQISFDTVLYAIASPHPHFTQES